MRSSGGLGFEGRKEFSFQPVNKGDYAHGSAQNIGQFLSQIFSLPTIDDETR